MHLTGSSSPGALPWYHQLPSLALLFCGPGRHPPTRCPPLSPSADLRRPNPLTCVIPTRGLSLEGNREQNQAWLLDDRAPPACAPTTDCLAYPLAAWKAPSHSLPCIVSTTALPKTLWHVLPGPPSIYSAAWKTPSHPLRTDARFQLSGIPTLVHWKGGAVAAKLGAELERARTTAAAGQVAAAFIKQTAA